MAQGNSRSRLALDILPLTEGRCLLVPESVDEGPDLAQGGVTSLKEAFSDLSRIIQRAVEMEPGTILILDDTIAKPTDPMVKRSKFNIAVYQAEVFYWIGADQYASDEFEIFVRQPRYSVALTGFVTKMKWENKPRLELTDEVLRAAAAQIQAVLIGAFDGEGFILWHRPST